MARAQRSHVITVAPVIGQAWRDGDALLALVVRPGDQVLTSDPDDLTSLIGARGVIARLVRV